MLDSSFVPANGTREDPFAFYAAGKETFYLARCMGVSCSSNQRAKTRAFLRDARPARALNVVRVCANVRWRRPPPLGMALELRDNPAFS
jgi:hypothetical protein